MRLPGSSRRSDNIQSITEENVKAILNNGESYKVGNFLTTFFGKATSTDLGTFLDTVVRQEGKVTDTAQINWNAALNGYLKAKKVSNEQGLNKKHKEDLNKLKQIMNIIVPGTINEESTAPQASTSAALPPPAAPLPPPAAPPPPPPAAPPPPKPGSGPRPGPAWPTVKTPNETTQPKTNTTKTTNRPPQAGAGDIEEHPLFKRRQVAAKEQELAEAEKQAQIAKEKPLIIEDFEQPATPTPATKNSPGTSKEPQGIDPKQQEQKKLMQAQLRRNAAQKTTQEANKREMQGQLKQTFEEELKVKLAKLRGENTDESVAADTQPNTDKEEVEAKKPAPLNISTVTKGVLSKLRRPVQGVLGKKNKNLRPAKADTQNEDALKQALQANSAIIEAGNDAQKRRASSGSSSGGEEILEVKAISVAASNASEEAPEFKGANSELAALLRRQLGKITDTNT